MTNPQVESTFDLNVHVARLLMNEPFFAALSRRVDKRPSQAIPTAAVLVNPYTAQFEMLYNPNFFEKLTDAQRRDIIKHELYSHLQDLPEGCLKPEQGEFADYPRGMSAEWYLAKLKENNFNPEKNPNQSNQDCDGEGTGEGSGEGVALGERLVIGAE